MSVGTTVVYRQRRYEVRAMTEQFIVIGQEADPVEVAIPYFAAPSVLTVVESE